ncbi:MAG: T9SS type A sorting domain-containing protein [Candidatus Hatepunaea meridiana]|nr:T9SS type A sorting domain-containing protein [Candidatus Hatepunaea meridiana]
MIAILKQIMIYVGRLFCRPALILWLSMSLLALLNSQLIAQPDTLWVRYYDMHSCYDMKPVSDTSFALGGSTNSLESRGDFHLVVTDTAGRELWNRVLVDTGRWNSHVSSISLSDNGELMYMVGTGRTPSDGSGFIALLSLEGDSLWMLPYGGLLAYLTTSLPDENDGVYVAGSTNDYNEYGSRDGYLLNVDEEGEELWYQVYGGEGTDTFSDMVHTQDGGFALVGRTSSFGGGGQFYLVKTDSRGEEQWSGAYGDSVNSDIAVTIGEMPDGGFVMAGWTAQGIHTDMLVIRVNEEGEEVWQRCIEDREKFRDLVVLPNGDFVLAGDGPGTPHDLILIRMNEDGEIIWEATWDMPGRSQCYSVVMLQDGGYALAGHLTGSPVFLARTEPDPVNAIWEVDPSFPSLFTLHLPYPNPFNSMTSFKFSLPQESQVEIKAYDLSGRYVDTVVNIVHAAGVHQLNWTADDLPSGMYLIRFEASEFKTTQKVTLIR